MHALPVRRLRWCDLHVSARLHDLARGRWGQVDGILQGVGEGDRSGLELLEIEAARRRAGGDLFVVLRRPPTAKRLNKLGLTAIVGEDRPFKDKRAAIAAAAESVRLDTCADRDKRAFEECASRPDRRREIDRAKQGKETPT